MTVSGVIFDLDGTLLDTIRGLANSMNVALTERGFKGHSIEAYKGFVGRGIENLVKYALPDGETDATVQGILQAMRDHYAQEWPRTTKPYPGVLEMLQGLFDRGMKVSILSNKPHKYTVQMVEVLLPGFPFDDVLGARESTPIKPAPDAALEIARGWVLPPNKIAFVGDSDVDMETAVNASMLPIGVMWGFRNAQELADSGGRVLVANVADLLTVLT